MDWKILLTVFAGASLALMATSSIGILAGRLLARYVSEQVLSLIAVWPLYSSARERS